jgi:hypothetical protein
LQPSAKFEQNHMQQNAFLFDTMMLANSSRGSKDDLCEVVAWHCKNWDSRPEDVSGSSVCCDNPA